MVNGYCYSPRGTRLSTNNRGSTGYIQASHWLDGKTVVFNVHQLAALQYFGDAYTSDPTAVVIHLDGDPTNNHKENLALGNRHDVSMAIPAAKRSKRGRPNALTDEQVIEVKNRLKNQPTPLPQGFLVKLSKEYNVGYSVISKIRYNQSFKHLQ